MKNNIISDKSEFNIRINRRNNTKNTHNNIVDNSISKIIPYKLITFKFMLSILLYIISLGTLYILVKIFPQLYLKLNCIQCDIQEADIFVIIDHTDKIYYIKALYENFYRRNTLIYYLFSLKTSSNSHTVQSPYSGQDYSNLKRETLVFYYRHNKYIYNDLKKEFEPVQFILEAYTNNEIHNLFGAGITDILDYNYLLNKFGLNLIVLESRSFYRILLDQLLHPFYIYQICSVIIWIRNSYIIFCVVVLVSGGFILCVNSYQIYKNYQRISNFTYYSRVNILRKLMSEENNYYDINHKLEILNNHSQYIVPGDIIELQQGETVACDCILLEGFCTVNESDLSGESTVVMKTPLPTNNNKFDFLLNKKSILYNGTKIDNCESENKKSVFALVINTGFNTQRADLIQNILFPKQTNFSFRNDIIVFLGGMLCIFIISVILFLHIRKNMTVNSFKSNLNQVLDLLTVVFPPSLPICMTFSAFYFHYSLRKKQISCISDSRMNAAGRVNIIVLDKTGTLTEEGLNLYGYQTTKITKMKADSNDSFEEIKHNDNFENVKIGSILNNSKRQDQKSKSESKIELDEIETSAKIYNYVHQEFWKKFCEENVTKLLSNDNRDNKDIDNSNINERSIYQENKHTLEEYIKDSNDSIKEELPVNNTIFPSSEKSKKSEKSEKSKKSQPKKYQTDLNLNIIYFVECLATCHSIDKLKGNHFGNNIDKKIFESMGWFQLRTNDDDEFNTYSDNNKSLHNNAYSTNDSYNSNKIKGLNQLNYYMTPRKAYKITEVAYFKNINKIVENASRLKDYRLKIIKRFDFSSKLQSMSVITYNNFDKSYRFFIKGSPERIEFMCKLNSLPCDFNERLMEHTQNGFRVLACATKFLPTKRDYELESDRSVFECELTFLGFIIFKNKLKRDTKHVISKLNRSHCKLVMATGDNPFTSISVAKESEILQTRSRIYMIDLDNSKLNGGKQPLLKFSYMSQQANSNNELINKEDDKGLSKEQNMNNELNELYEFEINQENNKEKDRTARTDRQLLYKEPLFLFSDKKNKNKDSLLNNNRSNVPLPLPKNNEISNLQTFLNLWIDKFEDQINNHSSICISGKAFTYILRKFQDKSNQYYKEDFINSNQKYSFLNKTQSKTKPEILHETESIDSTGLNETYSQLSKLIQLINDHGKIFYRMSPGNKVELVNFFKENKTNIVAMCGDGSNDCGALLCADVGISIKQVEGSNITSHFYCEDESIQSVETIIKNGLACFENSRIIFQYMLIYAIIELTTFLVLAVDSLLLTNAQYLFIDLFVIFIKSLATSMSGPNMKIIKDNPTKNLLNFKFIFTIIGQLYIQVTTIVIYYFIFLQRWVQNEPSSKSKDLNIYNSYLFVLTVFQYSSYLFSINYFAKNKKGVFSYKTYIIYTACLIFFVFSLITINYFNEFAINFSLVYLVSTTQLLTSSSQICKLVTISFGILNMMITFLFEYLIDKYFD